MMIKLVSVGQSSATESETVLMAAMNFTVVRTALLACGFSATAVDYILMHIYFVR